MKKLLMIISAAFLMVACGGEDCKKECTGKDKKECTKGDKEGCKKDCKKACCSKDVAHEGHAEEGHACEPGCTKACCADKNNEDTTDSTSVEEVEVTEEVEAPAEH
jgi:hypothetical protein